MNNIVENTNLYLVEKRGKSINIDSVEVKTFLDMQVLVGIRQILQYDTYWSQELRYLLLSDAMSLKRYEQLRHFFHVVDNDALPDKETGKLANIRPMIEAIRIQCVEVEPEEYHSVEEQIIPNQTKPSKVPQYNPKKPRKWGFQNLVRAGASGFMYNLWWKRGKHWSWIPKPAEMRCCCSKVLQIFASWLELQAAGWKLVLYSCSDSQAYENGSFSCWDC